MTIDEFKLFSLQIGIFDTGVLTNIFEELKDAEGTTGTISMYLFTYV